MTTETPEPLDTLEPPHEPAVPRRNTIFEWMLVLSGPIIWIFHFAAVYLFAEAACRAESLDGFAFVGVRQMEWFVVGATALGVAAILVLGGISRQRVRTQDETDDPLFDVGVVLSIGSAIATLAVGLPVLWLDSCVI